MYYFSDKIFKVKKGNNSLKKWYDQFAVRICKYSHGNKQTCTVLNNSNLKMQKELHVKSFWWNILIEKCQYFLQKSKIVQSKFCNYMRWARGLSRVKSECKFLRRMSSIWVSTFCIVSKIWLKIVKGVPKMEFEESWQTFQVHMTLTKVKQ